MIKKYLLKLAHLINMNYRTIEIKHEDYIKFGNDYYTVIKTNVIKETGCLDTLNIEAYNYDKWRSENS